MATTVKTYSYNGSVITDTSKGIRFTDGVMSARNWERAWTDKEKTDRGITWTETTTYVGGSASAEKLAELRQQRNNLLEETDYLALSDNTLSSDMKTYRQSLRDITKTYSSLDAEGFSWPTKPS